MFDLCKLENMNRNYINSSVNEGDEKVEECIDLDLNNKPKIPKRNWTKFFNSAIGKKIRLTCNKPTDHMMISYKRS
jgi:hypothetical protein